MTLLFAMQMAHQLAERLPDVMRESRFLDLAFHCLWDVRPALHCWVLGFLFRV